MFKNIAFIAFLLAFVSLNFVASVFAVETRSNWATEAFKKNCEAVVCIQGDKVDEFSSARDSGKSYNGMGTGIIIDERGYIVTNFHVVDGIRQIQVTTYDKTQFIGTLLARDTDTDLAIIKINARKPLKTITLGRSDDLMPGENCLAIGNPYGYAFSLTDGRISGIEREVDVNDTLVYRVAIQTNTEINPGNSGGPLINVEGEMIGINAAIRQGAAGIAFAIPIDQVVEVAAKLMAEIGEQSSSHGLKVYQSDNIGKSDSALSSGNRYSVVVESVESNSPASKAGLQKGDTIKSIGKFSMTNKLDFYRAWVDRKPQEDVAFTISRDSETFDVAVSPGPAQEEYYARSTRRGAASPKRTAITPKTGTPAKKIGSAYEELVWDVLGIRYAPVSAAEYKKTYASKFPNYPHGGVVVKAVREGSPIAEKGVMRDDVIVGIHEWTTTSDNDLHYIGKNWDTIKPVRNEVKILLFREVDREIELYETFIPWK